MMLLLLLLLLLPDWIPMALMAVCPVVKLKPERDENKTIFSFGNTHELQFN